MRNKLLVCVCALALFGMVGCRKDKTDLFAVDEQLAQKTLVGTYVYTAVDSTTMSTTFYEWNLAKDGTGYYQQRTTGNGTVQDNKKTLTWNSSMSEINLGMDVTVTFEDATTENLLWTDGVLYLPSYATVKVANSTATTSATLDESLQDVTFILDDTLYYQREDSIPYLKWTSDVAYYAPEDTASAKAQYLSDLAAYSDTIKWYIRKFGNVASAHIDSVTGELVDLVIVDTTAAKRGKNAGKHGITFLVSSVDTIVEMRNVGPLNVARGTIALKREGNRNIGSFSYRYVELTEEVYTDPTSNKAIVKDSTFTMPEVEWTIQSIINGRTFDVLLSGASTLKYIEEKAGVEVTNEQKDTEKDFQTLSLSGFVISKGVVDYQGETYNLKND